MSTVHRIPNTRSEIALHELSQSAIATAAPNLLLLHPLGASADYWRERALPWKGRVFALDFSGHGASPASLGRGYSSEILAGDADAALAHLGPDAPCVLVGAGVGAYVALLLAGGRPDEVASAVLTDGAGLAGGGPTPTHPIVVGEPWAPLDADADCDPAATASLENEVRPPEYASQIAGRARRLLFVGAPQPPPPWWERCSQGPNAECAETDLRSALDAL